MMNSATDDAQTVAGEFIGLEMAPDAVRVTLLVNLVRFGGNIHS